MQLVALARSRSIIHITTGYFSLVKRQVLDPRAVAINKIVQ